MYNRNIRRKEVRQMTTIDISGAGKYAEFGESMEKRAFAAHERLESGEPFTGWLHLPSRADESETRRVFEAADRIRQSSDVLLVIGIGGSYLGARAVTDVLCPPPGNSGTQLVFAGNGLSGAYTDRLLRYLEDRDFSINVISKSGTTTEPAAAFRIFERLLERKYGAGAAKRVYATTDAEKGALRSMARERGYESFVIPDDVGGRYSVLTPVGLLPIAAAGADAAGFLKGAAEAELSLGANDMSNPAHKYACVRQAMYEDGKKIELLAVWEPTLRYVAEWWKQLFGESEGKEHKGIFPASLEYTADLHSMGQYIQQGERTLAETFLWCEPTGKAEVPFDENDGDGLNWLAGKKADEINRTALEAVKRAHIDGGVPCLEINMGPPDARSLGGLLYFFELACALSAYISGVCPFDQPGVEAYKKNMFRMLKA
jgi:glucose-6-phosphate isomerase